MKIISLFKNPLWRAKSIAFHVGSAHAPTLWEFDANGFAHPTNGRSLSFEENEWVNKYNAERAAMNEAQRRAIDSLMNELFPLNEEAGRNTQESNRDVIDRIRRAVADAEKNSSPLILDLDGDGVETVALAFSGIYFDHNANGFAEKTGWAHADDGLLVRDLDGNGQIETGRELFGNQTRLVNGGNAANGFEALAELDEDGNGLVDAADVAFQSLRIWKDADGDGITDNGELLSLEEAGIQRLTTGYTETGNGSQDAQGNQHRQTSSYTTTQAQTRTMTDVWFSIDLALTLDKNTVAVPAAILALPDVAGMGNVASLRQAMARDESGNLNQTLQAWMQADAGERVELLHSLIYQWTGTSAIAATSRGSYVDARKLAVLEAVLGDAFTQNGWGSSPGPNAATLLHGAFDRFAKYVQRTLLLQTEFKPLLEELALVWDEPASRFTLDATQLVATWHEQWAKTAEQRLDDIPLDTWAEKVMDFSSALRDQGASGEAVLTAIQSAAESEDEDGFGRWVIMLTNAHGLTRGTEQDDELQAADPTGPNVLSGGRGNDRLRGDQHADVLLGGAGNDQLMGESGADRLSGGEGNDTVHGQDGQDTLAGDTGDDQLDGGAGSDTYVFNLGDGHDTIAEWDSQRYYFDQSSDIDVLRLGSGLTAANTHLGRIGNDIQLSWGTADSVTLQHYFSDETTGPYRIERIEFEDGAVWQLEDIAARLTYVGTTGDDYITGFTAFANRMHGGNGNDQLNGGTLADVINGDAGNDHLDGGTGSDTYLFNLGDGHDTIADWDSQRYYAGQSNDIDVLRLGPGLTAANTHLSRIGNDLQLSWGTADSVTLQHYFSDETTGPYRIERIEFEDGAVWQLEDVAARLTYVGTTGNDYITGFTAFANRMHGGNGNDQLNGGTLADVIHGEAGSDTLRGGAGADQLSGGQGNDSLSGETGDDTLNGGADNDHLDGDLGSDTYVFNLGDGHDTIADWDSQRYYTGQSNDIDVLRLGPGLTAANTHLSRIGNDLQLSWGESDSVTLQHYFSDETTGPYRIERIEFEDGAVWQLEDIAARLTYVGTTGDDYITGFTAFANRMHGGNGNDQLNGGTLADVINGDAGNDHLDGGTGSDTYLFNLGDGHDTIADWDSQRYYFDQSSDIDVLRLGSGLTAANTRLGRIGNDLQLSWGTADSVTLQHYFSDERTGSYRIERIAFEDGAVWQLEDIAARLTYVGTTGDDYITGFTAFANRMHGGNGNDQLNGGTLADVIHGDAGSDTLRGGEGEDQLSGGTGDDHLDGDLGSDTYLFNLGDGHDTIADWDSQRYYAGQSSDTDVLRLGSGLTVANTHLSRIGNDLQLSWGTADSVTLQHYFSDETTGSYRIERIDFTDGTRWELPDIAERLNYVGAESNDYAVGFSDYANRMRGGAGDDYLTGGLLADVIHGEAGNDSLQGGASADQLSGGEGNDTLSGHHGDDELAGGSGNDHLVGGAGSDTYVFNLGDGHDTITDADLQRYQGLAGDTDTLRLGAGLDMADTRINRVGDHLQLSWGESDSVTIQHYFIYDSTGPYRIERIDFADGTQWLPAQMNALISQSSTLVV